MAIAEIKDRDLEFFNTEFQRVHKEISKVIVGYSDVIDDILMTILARGHALLEGVPGLGKTKLVQTLSDALHLKSARIQFTPDLMPADIVGTNVVRENEHGDKYLDFQPGPIFANVILADEINRATPKTQSALLEAMQEKTVTVGKQTYVLDKPFVVLATLNPLELEATYPLPEAQLDRFFIKVKMGFPEIEDIHTILDRTTSLMDANVERVWSAEKILRASRNRSDGSDFRQGSGLCHPYRYGHSADDGCGSSTHKTVPSIWGEPSRRTGYRDRCESARAAEWTLSRDSGRCSLCGSADIAASRDFEFRR